MGNSRQEPLQETKRGHNAHGNGFLCRNVEGLKARHFKSLIKLVIHDKLFLLRQSNTLEQKDQALYDVS